MVDSSETEPPPAAWPEEFDAPIAKLGTPVSVHAFPEEAYRRRIRLTIYLLASGIVSPIAAGTVMILLGLPPNFGLLYINILFIAVALWNFRVTRHNRSFRVVEYETGILSWRNGRILSLPWDDLRAVYLQADGLTKIEFDAPANSFPQLYFVPRRLSLFQRLSPMVRLSHSQLRLVRNDGEELAVPSYLTDFDSLLAAAQKEAYRRFWPDILGAAAAGEEVEFLGTRINVSGFGRFIFRADKDRERIRVGPTGISFPHRNKEAKRQFIDWKDFRELQVAVLIAVKVKGWWKGARSLGALGWIANPHLLIHLIHQMRDLHAAESPDAGGAQPYNAPSEGPVPPHRQGAGSGLTLQG